MSAKLWVIAAGKGGVGKTFTTSSLGITLSKLGYKVLLVDFDMSGANLHTSFGISLSSKNISSYFQKKSTFTEVIQNTQIPHLSMIQGFWDSWSAPDISLENVQTLISECRKTSFDYVLFDLGPGANPINLELFHEADEKILVSNAEPTAIEKNYRFVEAYLCHGLKVNLDKSRHFDLFKAISEYRGSNKESYFSFRKYLKNSINLDSTLFDEMEKKPVKLIINSCRSHLDQDLGHSIKSVSKKYFDFPLDYVGSIDFDNAVWQSVRGQEPVLIEKPFTPLAGQFLSICKLMTNPNFSANYYRAII